MAVSPRCGWLVSRLGRCRELGIVTPCTRWLPNLDPPAEEPIVDDTPDVEPDPDPPPLDPPDADAQDALAAFHAAQQWAGHWRFEGHQVPLSGQLEGVPVDTSCSPATAERIVLDVEVGVSRWVTSINADGSPQEYEIDAFTILTGDYAQLYADRFGPLRFTFSEISVDFKSFGNVTPEALWGSPGRDWLPPPAPCTPVCRILSEGMLPDEGEAYVGVLETGEGVVCDTVQCAPRWATASFNATALLGFPAWAVASLRLGVEDVCGDAWDGVLFRYP